MIDSTSDERTANNVMRHEYRPLTDEEKEMMRRIKDLGLEVIAAIKEIETVKPGAAGRECALARTKIEEAVMWAVKGLTG